MKFFSFKWPFFDLLYFVGSLNNIIILIKKLLARIIYVDTCI